MGHIKVGDTLTLVGNWRRHTREDGMRKVKTQLQILCTSWKELGGIVGFPREVFGRHEKVKFTNHASDLSPKQGTLNGECDGELSALKSRGKGGEDGE